MKDCMSAPKLRRPQNPAWEKRPNVFSDAVRYASFQNGAKVCHGGCLVLLGPKKFWFGLWSTAGIAVGAWERKQTLREPPSRNVTSQQQKKKFSDMIRYSKTELGDSSLATTSGVHVSRFCSSAGPAMVSLVLDSVQVPRRGGVQVEGMELGV